MIEKVALALVLMARQMRPYFQDHSITVRTDYPILKILSKPDLVGSMIGWSIELSEFNIRYELRGSIKYSCLADFFAELTPLSDISVGWTIYVDDVRIYDLEYMNYQDVFVSYGSSPRNSSFVVVSIGDMTFLLKGDTQEL